MKNLNVFDIYTYERLVCDKTYWKFQTSKRNKIWIILFNTSETLGFKLRRNVTSQFPLMPLTCLIVKLNQRWLFSTTHFCHQTQEQYCGCIKMSINPSNSVDVRIIAPSKCFTSIPATPLEIKHFSQRKKMRMGIYNFYKYWIFFFFANFIN